MYAWYRHLEEKITVWMREEGFYSYTVNLVIDRNESINSKSFAITSIETTEKEIASFRIYQEKKYYCFTVTGFQFLEEEIRNLKNIFNSLEDNDYYEESAIYHDPVKVAVHKYTPSLVEMETTLEYINECIRLHPGFNQEFLTLTTVKNQSFIFNSSGYQNHFNINYSYVYLGLYYSYTDNHGNQLQESEWEYVLLTEKLDFAPIIQTLVTDINQYVTKTSIPLSDYKIIFHRNISSSLIDMVVSALYGNNIWHNQSFIKKAHMNQQLFSNKFTIIEDPMMAGSIYNSPVDYSGIPIRKKYLIDQGVVKNFLLNREYALKLEMQTTGNSWFGAIGYTNIYLEPGKSSYDQLIGHMGTGIIVKSLLGSGFDEDTGEISVSIKGYYIEKGVFQGTINGTINGHILDILRNIEVGNDIIYDQEMNSPSIEVSPMKFAPSN